VRVKAFELLDKNFTPELLPVFQSVAAGEDGMLKLKALLLTKRKLLSRGDDLVPIFVSFLHHADPRVRVQAIWGLRGFHDERVTELLGEAIADKDPQVHEAALSAYGGAAGEREIARLARLGRDAGPGRPARGGGTGGPPVLRGELPLALGRGRHRAARRRAHGHDRRPRAERQGTAAPAADRRLERGGRARVGRLRVGDGQDREDAAAPLARAGGVDLKIGSRAAAAQAEHWLNDFPPSLGR